MSSTTKTIWGFLVSLIGKYTPIKFGGDTIEDVFNYLKISETLSTSGQPTEKQFHSIRNAGFTTVINLLPHDTENSLENEDKLLWRLGLRYIHIPVRFIPKEEAFHQFVESMETAANEKIWIHCAANARVSAFLYRYRCSVLGEEPSIVKQDLHKIWTPFGIWKKFLHQGGPVKPPMNR